MLSETEMVVSIVALGCGTGIACSFLATIRTALTRRLERGKDDLLAEIRALRDEVRQLRQQNNEVILSLDTGLDHVSRRVTHLEGTQRETQRQPLPAVTVETSGELVGTGR